MIARAAPRLATFALAVACVCSLSGCAPDGSDAQDEEHPTRTSLLAVGDTGSVWGPMPSLFEGQLAVGAALQREHEADPVDALVLLGDNFYPSGLLAHELEARIVQNVVRPYCAFVDPSTRMADVVSRFCGGSRWPVPQLIAIVGNHDVLSPGSVELQREAVPRYVRNWDMPDQDGPVVRELPGGLSLVLLFSEWPWDDAASRALARALEEARGPWRVIIGHRPPITGHPQLKRMVASASRESGHIVHAYLAGHVHGLVAIRGSRQDAAPVLTVIAGSGSQAKLQQETEYRIEGAEVMQEALGFVRLDVTGRTTSPQLRITLSKARPSAALALFGTTTLARYEIELDGALERVD